jgi:hypothetical protein
MKLNYLALVRAGFRYYKRFDFYSNSKEAISIIDIIQFRGVRNSCETYESI